MNLTPTLPNLDILAVTKAYLVGIKGVGMTALAVLLQEAGVLVQGADVSEAFVTDLQLRDRGISVMDFSTAELPEDVGVVVYSGAHRGSQHPLVLDALRRNIPCLNLAQAVGLVSQHKETITVCGVGGKSTTSAMLSWILQYAGKLPSFAVGVGNIPNLGCSAHWEPTGSHFVVEADEYVSDPQLDKREQSPRFLSLFPRHAICTSLTFDHPDVYQSMEDTTAAFRAFFSKLPGGAFLVINGDQQELSTLAGEFAEEVQVITVGSSESNRWQLQNLRVENGSGKVDLHSSDLSFEIELPLPGYHNLRDAAYAAVLSIQLGVSPQHIQEALRVFRSTTRRFELVGTTPEGLVCYDDYAHHPRELRAIAETVKEWFSNKSVAVAFQPHTFSRTKALFSDFVDALELMPGEIVLLPIFSSAREQFDDSISSQDLTDALLAKGKVVRTLQSQAELLEYVQHFAQTGNVFLTLGAGDIYKVYEQLTFRST